MSGLNLSAVLDSREDDDRFRPFLTSIYRYDVNRGSHPSPWRHATPGRDSNREFDEHAGSGAKLINACGGRIVAAAKAHVADKLGEDAMNEYFSDRESGPKPRAEETINRKVWLAIAALIKLRVEDGSLAYGFPSRCPDGSAIIGTDLPAMARIIHSEIEGLVDEDNDSLLHSWDPSPDSSPPDTPVILDLVEFVAKHVALPSPARWHDFFQHHHLQLDREEGLWKFAEDVNRQFSRNGLAYRLTDSGVIERELPAPLSEMLKRVRHSTGDRELDHLLDVAIKRSLQPQAEARQDALEKLWDAFERLKTIECPGNKKKGVELLIDRAVASDAPLFRSEVTKEFRALTEIGNGMRIRHAEIGTEPIGCNGERDYLFWRAFSLIWFMLKATGRLSDLQNDGIDIDEPF